mmetsp:Transcript_28408/g.40193  ORF Transcript_28408/g.40193 Transcript_28408/m.40193 type:complete len:81 (+) Transcript_28408:321-563(+)
MEEDVEEKMTQVIWKASQDTAPVITQRKTKANNSKLCVDCQEFPSQHHCERCNGLVCGICCEKRGLEGRWVCLACEKKSY